MAHDHDHSSGHQHAHVHPPVLSENLNGSLSTEATNLAKNLTDPIAHHEEHGSGSHGYNNIDGPVNDNVSSDLHSLLFSCVVIFFMAAAYEGVKWFRLYFQMWSTTKETGQRVSISFKDLKNRHVEDALIQKSAGSVPNGGDGGENQDQVYVPTVTPGASQPQAISRRLFDFLNNYISRSSPLVSSRFIEAALYCLQLTLAYWLMLIIMTYNVYLTAAVVLGAAFGYWLFAGLLCVSPYSSVCVNQKAEDACH